MPTSKKSASTKSPAPSHPKDPETTEAAEHPRQRQWAVHSRPRCGDPVVTASTVSESNASEKTGEGAAPGLNPTNNSWIAFASNRRVAC